ncbi:FtsX-like permease family protein [Actinomadura algeriensis]|uniref:ABC transport system permease protein n=1 Tax=Actinomadura algeriensis TaxID=1679523 RepID=A0ABR9JIV9_9ACTN|nr:FtsX-like permease family protein [Actinomadura algeriensis]MBE1530399.1 putative ABC transport system permease protein [Actinomadura algeriensis]
MFALALSTLRHRRAVFAGGFVALFFAAALLTACGMLMDTGLRGRVAPERHAGAPIIVAGDPDAHLVEDDGDRETKPNTARARIAASLTDRVRAVPGVRSVVPEVTVPAVVDGRAVDGHGWESAALTPAVLQEGRAPAAAGEIVVDPSARHAVGTDVTVLHPLGTGTYRVVGVTARSLENPAVFLGTAEARRLTAARPGLTAIGVWPASGASVPGTAAAVRDAVHGTGATVHTGVDRGRAEFPDSGGARTKLVSMGAALGGTSLVVALLAVVGTFGLMLQQRERELALLRAVAATPGQLRRMIGREAVLLGLAATVPGAVAGLFLGSRLHAAFADLGAVPANLPLVTGPVPPAVAVAATVPAAWLAARIAARRITRLRPVEALGEAALEPPRTPWFRLVAGTIALAGAIVLGFVLSSVHTERGSGPLTPLTALAFAASAGLLGPVLTRLAVPPIVLPLRAAGQVAGLAAANLRAGARRLAAVVAPLTMMVALGSTLLFAETTIDDAAASQAEAGTVADHVAGPAVPGPAADALRRVPGVRTVTEVLHTRVRFADTPYSAQGVTPAGLSHTMDLGVRSGSLDAFGEGTMAVREGLGMNVGDVASFALADGAPVKLRVVAVYHRGLGFGDLTLPHSLVAAHVDVPMGTALIAAPGATRDALNGAAAAYPGVTLYARTSVPDGPSGSAVNYLSLGMIVAFAAISAVNTLAMATAGRVRELAMFRLAGGTRRQVLRMLRWETLTAALLATVLGVAIAYATLTAFSTGMTGSGSPHVPIGGLLAVIGATAVLAVLGTTLPARLILRRPPADIIGARE